MATTIPPVGSIIEAHGLVSRSELNGQQATVNDHSKPPGREECVVAQFKTGAPVALMMKNVKVISVPYNVGETIEAHGLVAKKELNSVCGKVINKQFTNSMNIYTVEFPSPHGVMSLKESNARRPTTGGSISDFPVGTVVEAHGLIQEKGLNGKTGTVASTQGDVLVVQFEQPFGTMSIKMSNLRIKSAPPAAVTSEPAAVIAEPTPPQPEQTNGSNPTIDFPVNCEVEATGLQSKVTMNGAIGTVAGHRTAGDGSGTWHIIVRFPIHGTMALLPQNLIKKESQTPATTTFPVGTSVVAHSLQSRTDLNQCEGVVVGHCGIDQVVVQFPVKGVVTLKVSNVTKGDDSSVSQQQQQQLPISILSPDHSSTALVRNSNDYINLMENINSLQPVPMQPSACEGFLNKKTPAMGRDHDRRWFSLRGQQLIYFEEKGRINLTPDYTILPAEGNGFSISGPGMSRKFELKADTPAAKMNWLKALESCTKSGYTPVCPNATAIVHLESACRAQMMHDHLAFSPKPPAAPTSARQTPHVGNVIVDDLKSQIERLTNASSENEKTVTSLRSEAEQTSLELQAANAEVGNLRMELEKVRSDLASSQQMAAVAAVAPVALAAVDLATPVAVPVPVAEEVPVVADVAAIASLAAVEPVAPTPMAVPEVEQLPIVAPPVAVAAPVALPEPVVAEPVPVAPPAPVVAEPIAPPAPVVAQPVAVAPPAVVAQPEPVSQPAPIVAEPIVAEPAPVVAEPAVYLPPISSLEAQPAAPPPPAPEPVATQVPAPVAVPVAPPAPEPVAAPVAPPVAVPVEPFMVAAPITQMVEPVEPLPERSGTNPVRYLDATQESEVMIPQTEAPQQPIVAEGQPDGGSAFLLAD